MQALFDTLRDSTTFWVIVVAAVVLAVAALVAGARLPRWLRSRRQLATMFDAYRADLDIAALEAVALERAAASPPWGCSECSTRGLCAITGCKRAKAVDS